jgi:hypothetical protein
MEWIEFNRWSRDVEQRLAVQSAQLSNSVQLDSGKAQPESAEARAHRLQMLLQHYPRTNPWGHPVADC